MGICISKQDEYEINASNAEVQWKLVNKQIDLLTEKKYYSQGDIAESLCKVNKIIKSVNCSTKEKGDRYEIIGNKLHNIIMVGTMMNLTQFRWLLGNIINCYKNSKSYGNNSVDKKITRFEKYLIRSYQNIFRHDNKQNFSTMSYGMGVGTGMALGFF